jgi:DNA repair protein RadA/Sms
MAKEKNQFLCTDCGDVFPKWTGKCPNCGEWNTLKEYNEPKLSGGKKTELGLDLIKNQEKTSFPLRLSAERISSQLEEVDRVLGGGFFPGAFVLFGGSPGIGKSTLALQIFKNISGAFYFSGEESKEQVMHRAERLKNSSPGSSPGSIFTTHSLEDICETVAKNRPPLAVIDSIQMIGSSTASFGTISQVKESADVLLKLAKATGTAIIIIGHVTKADEIAGPKLLEHIVDVVLRLEGESNSEVRILRSPKNRFGSTLEIGVFDMRGDGLHELLNPSEFFLAERAENASGSAISVVREGARNFLMEIQVLTLRTNFGQPRRTAHGIPLSKFHLLLAVVSKFSPFKTDEVDAYINVVGGLKISEPAADLAICAAILSSRTEKEIPADTIVLGEVGLSGEIRSVSNIEARLTEAAKLGFKYAIIPHIRNTSIKIPAQMKTQEVKSVGEMTKLLFRSR